ncbi:MAG: leucyl aminopeptidase [Candidatus Krumholzibacteriota bacterium]|nr:leucyl aminopeptidase [Candidatus Krumholzibacteriota bacterium]
MKITIATIADGGDGLAPASHLDGHENVVVFACAGEAPDLGGAAAADAALLDRVRDLGDFAGARGAAKLVYGARTPARWILAGLGPRGELDPRAWRAAGAAARKLLAGESARRAAFILPAGAHAGELVAALALAGYRYDRYISEESRRAHRLDAVSLLAPAGADLAALEAEAARAEADAAATLYARDLEGAPASEVTPRRLAAEAERIAAGSGGRIACRVLDEDALAAERFGALLAVGRGSAEPSRLVVLEYQPQAIERPARTLCLVGKGVTFDSGGLTIKTADKMPEMKADMGGAAAVLGVFRVLAGRDLPLRVVGLVPAVENMPDGAAYRPSDILATRSGLSVEVISTDAEGRLLLADALDYAGTFDPDLIIDVATLTGSCTIALGGEAAGMMANAAGAAWQVPLQVCGEHVGERLWPLPLFAEYAEKLESEVADLKNSGGRYGGASIAGKFLERFVGERPWIHLDIAGAVHTLRERDLTPAVPNGFGVRLLLAFLPVFAGESPAPGR